MACSKQVVRQEYVKTMETIYRKVLCSERLPKEKGLYITDVSVFTRYCGNNYFEGLPIWWLEEITLPSNEEMQELADITYPKNAFTDENKQRDYDLKRYGFKNGFNKAIELIKGK